MLLSDPNTGKVYNRGGVEAGGSGIKAYSADTGYDVIPFPQSGASSDREEDPIKSRFIENNQTNIALDERLIVK